MSPFLQTLGALALLASLAVFSLLSARLTNLGPNLGCSESKEEGLRALQGGSAEPWYPGQPNPLREWFDNYSEGPLIHKWLHYFDIYHRHLARFRGKNATIVEFGVQVRCE
jgi:hypothetical protein